MTTLNHNDTTSNTTSNTAPTAVWSMQDGVTLVGLGGYGRTGKDTLAARLVSAHGFTLASFGEHVRDVLVDINPLVRLDHDGPWRGLPDAEHTRIVYLADVFEQLGYEGAKRHSEVRRLMQDTGDAIKLRQPDFWVNQILNRRQPGQKLVMTGMRTPADAAAIRGAGGLVVRVNRPGVGALNDHPNEKQLDGYDRFDAVIDNDGTPEQLWDKADALLSLIPGAQAITG